MKWLHERDNAIAHSIVRRTWDAQIADCGKELPHDVKPGSLQVWSKPCEACSKEREKR